MERGGSGQFTPSSSGWRPTPPTHLAHDGCHHARLCAQHKLEAVSKGTLQGLAQPDN